MRPSFRTGISFGVTSGIITTLGLMVGLHSGTHSQVAVLGGIATIAIADAFSDALGMHISQESRDHRAVRTIWESTLATFAAKFLFALTFAVPVLLLPLDLAMAVSVLWGMFAISLLSFLIAKGQHGNAWQSVSEHLLIALIVVLTTHYVGDWIRVFFV